MTSRRRLASALDKVFPHLLILLYSLGDCVSGHGPPRLVAMCWGGVGGSPPPLFLSEGRPPPVVSRRWVGREPRG